MTKINAALLSVSLFLVLCFAKEAQGQVSWGVNFQVNGGGCYPPPVYVPRPVYYVPPPPVYYYGPSYYPYGGCYPYPVYRPVVYPVYRPCW